jgi:hypothetical protein
VPSREVTRVRRAEEARRASALAGELIALWRQGHTVSEIHQRTGVAYRSIRATLAERATDADRAARQQAHRRGGPSATFSDRALTEGLGAVAAQLGCTPSLREYDELAPGLGLASGQTVYIRFGGWRRALAAAGLDSVNPTRTYAARWHIAACWRALESVADQLGDPPRYRRYVELAAKRDDLPSPSSLRARLGLWSSIAAELTAQRAAREDDRPAPSADATASPSRAAKRESAPRARGTRKESIESERLPTQVEVAALRYLAEHPGSSGTAVKEGIAIRHASQAWALLARLEREGLLVNEANGSGKASKNAWRLSKRGVAVLNGLTEGMYA